MKNPLLYILLMCGAAAVLFFCANAGSNGAERLHVANFEIMSDVDSAYKAFKEADERDMIPLANQLFHLMDKSETTDSLIQYASGTDKQKVTAHADYWMAEYLYQTQRQKESMTLAQTALKEAERIKDIDLQANINSLLSAVYSRLGMFEEGLKCLEFCYAESQRTGNKENISSDLNNMAAMFISLKQYDKAKQHIDKAIEIERGLQRSGTLAIRLGIASETYMLLNRLDDAEAFAREAYKIDSEEGRDGKAAIRLSQLASVLFKKGKNGEAKETLGKAIPVLKESGNIYSYIICENQMGDIFLQEKNIASAEKHYHTALQLSNDKEFRYMKQRALHGLWNTLRNTNADRAAQYLEQYTALSDTLHTEATEKQLANMQAQYEYNELQAENERLVFKSHIHTLLWIVGITACLLIITILSYLLYTKSKAGIIARQTDAMITLIEKREEPAAKDAAPAAEEKSSLEKTEKSKSESDEESEAETDDDKKSQNDAEFLNQFVTYVNTQLIRGKSVDTSDCASHMCVSPRHFSRKVMAITGFTPSAYINRIKINRAKRLLSTEPQLSITEVSLKSGFEDLAYFGKIFRQIEGKTPSKYKALTEKSLAPS